MVKILFLRHAESVANKSRIFSGQTDVPLTEFGLIQAEKVADYIINNYKIDAVYSSDLTRVKQTVLPTVNRLGLKVNYNKKLREIDVGAWGGVSIDEISIRDAETFNRYIAGDSTVHLGGAESFEDLKKRALEIFNEIVRNNDGKTVLVATHGGVIRTLCRVWLNLSVVQMQKNHSITNASITEVNIKGDKVEIPFIAKSDYL